MRGWARLAIAVALVAGCDRPREPEAGACLHRRGGEATRCPGVVSAQRTEPPRQSDPGALVIEGVHAARSADDLIVTLDLAGRFDNADDQNLYVMVGDAAAPPARYALSADDAYAAEQPYPIRSAVDLPHGLDLRIGVMAPAILDYTPQVYGDDPFAAQATGAAAGIDLEAGEVVRLRVPVERLCGAGGCAERLGVTVATARDYVGFVDQRSIASLARGEEGAAAAAAAPPAAYPRLDPATHRLAAISLADEAGGLRVEIETAAAVTDWAQTNLYVYLFADPPPRPAGALHDATGTTRLDRGWAFYCGVYAPRRLFCRRAEGGDLGYDTGYAARAELAAPDGVTLDSAGRRHVLTIEDRVLDRLLPRGARVGIAVAIGRDGFAPTTWYGLAGPAAAP